jgi:hypothetical protein
MLNNNNKFNIFFFLKLIVIFLHCFFFIYLFNHIINYKVKIKYIDQIISEDNVVILLLVLLTMSLISATMMFLNHKIKYFPLFNLTWMGLVKSFIINSGEKFENTILIFIRNRTFEEKQKRLFELCNQDNIKLSSEEIQEIANKSTSLADVMNNYKPIKDAITIKIMNDSQPTPTQTQEVISNNVFDTVTNNMTTVVATVFVVIIIIYIGYTLHGVYIGTTSENINPVKSEIGVVNNNTVELQNEVNTLKGTVDTLKESFGTLKNTTSNLQGTVGTLQNTTSKLQDNVGALENITSNIKSSSIITNQFIGRRLVFIEQQINYIRRLINTLQ